MVVVVLPKVVDLGVGSVLESYSNRLLSRDEEVEDDGGMRSCTKWGIVAINGESAHGFLGEARCSSREGSMNLWRLWQLFGGRMLNTYFAKVRAALDPQGKFRGLSNVLPNKISSAECDCRNLP
jgi:hypothetical protein